MLGQTARGESTAMGGALQGGVAPENLDHHHARLVEERTMSFRIMVRLEADLAQSACHEQTRCALNGAMAARASKTRAGGEIGRRTVSFWCLEGMV